MKLEELKEMSKGQPVTIVYDGETSLGFQRTNHAQVWRVGSTIFNTPSPDFELGFLFPDFKRSYYRDHPEREALKGRIKILTNHPIPIFHTAEDKELGLKEFPIEELCRELKMVDRESDQIRGYFTNPLDYAIAWAIYCEVSAIELIGADLWVDQMRPCANSIHFWLGRAFERGIVLCPHGETRVLSCPQLDGVVNSVSGFYGYHPETFPIETEMAQKWSNEMDLGDIIDLVVR